MLFFVLFFRPKKKKALHRYRPLGIRTIILNQHVSSQCQALLPVRLTIHFLQRKIASEMRHLMRQLKCHARWLSLLIRLNSNHVAFDQVVTTDSQGPVNCFQYKWTHGLAVDNVRLDKNHICSVTFGEKGPPAFKVSFFYILISQQRLVDMALG